MTERTIRWTYPDIWPRWVGEAFGTDLREAREITIEPKDFSHDMRAEAGRLIAGLSAEHKWVAESIRLTFDQFQNQVHVAIGFRA